MEPFFKVGDKVHIISEMKECPLVFTDEMYNKFGGNVYTISKVRTGYYCSSTNDADGCCYSLAEVKENYGWSSPMFVETEEKVKKASQPTKETTSDEIVTFKINGKEFLYKLRPTGRFFFQCDRDGNAIGRNRDIFEYLGINDLRYNLLEACVGKEHTCNIGDWPEATEAKYTLKFMDLVKDLVKLYNKCGKDAVREECEKYIKKYTDGTYKDGEPYTPPTFVTPSKIEPPDLYQFTSYSEFIKNFYQRRKREKEVTLVLKKTKYRFK